ncbi:MAG: exonuclease SbcCD subunit D [Spirochaetales bacterium]|nr:exonuclease SbcCD subunit D [Spirochaetales bacterium]
MKLFHLADLHLGKSVYEHDLIEDQRHVLNAVVEAAIQEQPACVIVAGDVFDRAVPSAEAVTLLGDFIAGLKRADPTITVAMIPGNHDSAARLSYLAPVLAGVNVHIASDAEACDHPVVVERDGERARLWMLPFLTPGALYQPAETVHPDERVALRSQADLFAEALRRILLAKPTRTGSASADGAIDILVCHAFARGGKASESERVFLGNAELVDSTCFDSFDYVALGHLHRPQAVGDRGRYPGAILAYTFAETGVDRGFLSLQASPGRVIADFRAVQPLRRMIRIHGRYDDVLADPRFDACKDDYVEAVLDDADAVLNPMDALRRRFPHILSLRQTAFERPLATDTMGQRLGGRASVADDFAAFHREMFGEEPPAESVNLFAQLYQEASREAE